MVLRRKAACRQRAVPLGLWGYVLELLSVVLRCKGDAT
jgi:hypothetical protein